MIYKSYIQKVNTLIKDSNINTGLNPISTLMYGKNITRTLLYFGHKKIKEMMENGIMSDKSKITHRLKITNAGSIDHTMIHQKETSSIDNNSIQQRAASFDLIFFLIPKTWDDGKGFDYSYNALNKDYYETIQLDKGRLVSTDGCNWYQARNGKPWDEEGVYSNDTLSKEYDKYLSGEESVIIGVQRFEIGNENIDLDITEIVNKFVSGELENNGIGIAFTPALERLGENKNALVSNFENYVSLFTNHTNTFFEPFVETQYHDYVNDDRAKFVLGKQNKLYLYCNLGGELTDLDELPLVTVKDSNDEVVHDYDGNMLENIEAKQFSTGIYYIDLKLNQKEYEPDTMLFDTWSNIKYNGTELDSVELDVTLKGTNMFFNIGNKLESNKRFAPNVSGINDSERIKRGDIRKVNITARVQYSTNESELITGMETRLYVMDGTRELDVLPWEPVNKSFLENYTVIDTNILIPQRYYMDVKIKYGMEEIIHHDVLHFDIVDDINNKYT